jgi:hypothetical protein
VTSGETPITRRWTEAIMATYAAPPLALVRGDGARVWDETGKSYLDLVAGIAVNVLGHAHPAVVEAVSRQVATLGHTSNLVANEPSVRLAERLLGLVGRDGKVFFANSGAEANEAPPASSWPPSPTRSWTRCWAACRCPPSMPWPASAAMPSRPARQLIPPLRAAPTSPITRTRDWTAARRKASWDCRKR